MVAEHFKDAILTNLIAFTKTDGYSTKLEFYSCVFTENTNTLVYTRFYGLALFGNCTFSNNKGLSPIILWEGNIQFNNTHFVDNSVDGCCLLDYGKLTLVRLHVYVEGSLFERNSASEGTICIDYADLIITGSTFRNNSNDVGGVIGMYTLITLTFSEIIDMLHCSRIL